MIDINYLESVGWMHTLRGLRNPLRSWNKNDSSLQIEDEFFDTKETTNSYISIGPNDLKLCKQLIKAGASHRKFLRHITIYCDITANLKFFDEFDTYLHVVKNSTSQMHTITKRDFTIEDFSNETHCPSANRHMSKTINVLNTLRKKYLVEEDTIIKKKVWRDMIEIMPQSYLYTRTCMFSYEVFLSMYHNRKNHKMSEWVTFCSTLREQLPYMDEFLKVIEKKHGV